MGVRRRANAALAGLATAVALLVPVGAHAAASDQFDHVVTSFDGTPIATTVFTPGSASEESPVPLVLMTHGWGGSRSTTADGLVGTLLDSGYAVITWDSRGFGDSGGEAEVDSQPYEVKDAQAILDYAATLPGIQLDGAGDPRVGMVGGSYAGGIQLELASADQRVDAIVPNIPWNDLPRALKPGGVLKLGWDELLYAAGFATALADGLDAPAGPQLGAYAPEIHRSEIEGTVLNDWTGAILDWFDARSPKNYINGAVLGSQTLGGIHAAVLDQQGVSDTLFDLNQGIANVTQAAANGTPVKLMTFCGGHAANLSCLPNNNGDVLTAATLTWFDKYLKGHDTDTGPAIEYQTQDGAWHGVDAWPSTTVASGAGDALLINQIVPTNPGTPGLGTVIAANPDLSPLATRIPLNVTGGTLLGVPRVDYSYTGVGLEAYVFAKLVDVDAAGNAVTVDDQVSPLKLTDLSPLNVHTRTLDLSGVAWNVVEAHQLFLELTTTSTNFSSSRTPSLVQLHAAVEVPGL
jgi:ABC-2 type transport system ATP-binding protein